MVLLSNRVGQILTTCHFGILILFAILKSVVCYSKYPVVLIISMDGFRHDYLEDCLTPNMIRLRIQGVNAPYLKNVFPTKTFPNHHSIATGVHPEVHGVLGSSVYDSKDGCVNKTVLGYSYELFHYNNDILPLWTVNELDAKDRHSGVLMWPGGQFPYGCKKTKPTFLQEWNEKIPFQQRIDTAISWITDPKTPANLVMAYFEDPDLHGHAFGIDSTEVRNQIKKLDQTILYLEKQLKEKNLTEVVNVFVVSDHGMISMDQSNIVDLSKYVDNTTYIAAGFSPVLQIFPKEEKSEEVLKGLEKARSASKDSFKIYPKNEIPTSWHYKNSSRTPPILVIANKGFAFSDIYESIEANNKKYNIPSNPRNKIGIHGYTNDIEEMYPLFFAWGPHISKGSVKPFNTVDLFPTWAYLLGVELENSFYSPPLLNLIKFVNTTTTTTTIMSLKSVNKAQQAAGTTGVWTYWLSSILAASLFGLILVVIFHYVKDIYYNTNGKPNILPTYRRTSLDALNDVEKEHLLEETDCEEETKA